MKHTKTILVNVITITLFSLTLISGCKKEETMPIACFNLNSSNAVSGDTISFVNCSENATRYLWDFGDGSTSAEQTPSHIYLLAYGDTLAHPFTIKLTAYTANNTNVIQKSISIGPRAIAVVDTLRDTTYIESPLQSAEVKNVVIEEFTGVRCPNGPSGNQVIADIETLHPGRIVSVSLHPVNSLGASYPFSQQDFRNTKAHNLFDYLGQVGYEPTAGIDRKLFSGESAILLDKTKWSAYVNAQLTQTSPVNIFLYKIYDSINHSITVIVELHYTQSVSEENKLTILLKQNDVVTAQLDGFVIDTFYTHQDVMRDFITNNYGDLITGTHEAGRVVRRIYTKALSSALQTENLKIVAFVHEFQNSELIYTAKELSVR